MQPIPRSIVDAFAVAFAGSRTAGFSAQEISAIFCEYSAAVRPFDHYGMKPTRKELFVESVYALAPVDQYCALHDLAARKRPSKYTYPPQSLRDRLRARLHASAAKDPIGLAFSRLSSVEFRKDWMTAHSRLLSSPAAAVTAARTMLETVFQTIVEERGGTPDTSGDIGKSMKQAQNAIGFSRRDHQAEHQIVSGLASVIGGVSAISNDAGDRHGTAQGVSLEDRYLATLCVNACGAVGLSFIERHLFAPMDAPAPASGLE
jgi:hypothetical protein